ncbi:MAG TPA: aldo/keto reductase [Actinophytocola sp.]|jgi:aryl-alcohol dehydrogenase-like predicted oxidoreductase|nr:aldo/keto reductase [Actinophytocola sp.]
MTTYHLLGNTGLRVSPLALGTMTFGQDEWGTDEDASRRIFARYLDSGGNFVDTANVYAQGRSEELVGKFIAESRTRDRVVLATKFAQTTEAGNPNSFGNGRKTIIAALDASLRRLGTDHVDVYWMHIWDTLTPVEETMSTLDGLVRAGKVRAIGLSNVPAWYVAKAQMLARARGWEPVAALQLEYSLVERAIEAEHVPAALDLGIGVVPWSPLSHGFLSGKYRRSSDDYAGSGRLDAEFFRSMRDFMGSHGEHDWKVLDTLLTVATELDRPAAQVALAWVLRRPGVTSTLIGASTVEQLDDNLAAWELDLPAGHRARLDEVSATDQAGLYRMFRPELHARFLTTGYRILRQPANTAT